MDHNQFSVSSVSLSAIVAMKLIKQANESSDLQIGYLQGLIQEEVVELTNCYPMLPELDQEQQQFHDKNIMQYSKKHHMDNNKTGIYIIGQKLDQYQLENFELQHRMQSLAKYAILLVYSPQMSQQGHPMPFFAYQINFKYLDAVLRGEEITLSDLSKWNSKFDKVYRQVPINLYKSPLSQAFLFQHRESLRAKYSHSFLTNNFNFNKQQLINALDDQIQVSEKINAEALKKLATPVDVEKAITINELIEYFLNIHKVGFLSDQVRKESINIIESELPIGKLAKA